jgi:nicotinate phosphoribosyltransferase
MEAIPAPTNPHSTVLLTDFYQISMALAYFEAGLHELPAVFELFFRRNPFKGEYTVFCGLDECLRLVAHLKFTDEHIQYLRTIIPQADPAFFDWLATVDGSQVNISALPEGTVCFPREPLIRVEGPLAVCQLLETPFLNLVNFPSLIATNAARMRVAAGPSARLMEFGLRRAQGPDGGISASRYSVVGGFDATSNVLAGLLFDVPIAGTHAHSFVLTFTSLADLRKRSLRCADGSVCEDFVALCLAKRQLLADAGLSSPPLAASESELAAYVAYAQAFPSGFLALVDTYDTVHSGCVNYCVVSAALADCGYRGCGIRLDSGDLAYLSRECRRVMRETERLVLAGGLAGADAKHCAYPGTAVSFEGFAARSTIVASNDINEGILHSLKEQGHEINTFGIGTNLVTCSDQPALGCVFKLVEIHGTPRIKLSADRGKMTLPGRKRVFRLFGAKNPTSPLLDLLTSSSEPAPVIGQRILCLHPLDEAKRAYVVPARIEELLVPVLTNGLLDPDFMARSAELSAAGSVADNAETLSARPELAAAVRGARKRCSMQLASLRNDTVRSLNPTPYKISVTQTLFDEIHALWLKEKTIVELE